MNNLSFRFIFCLCVCFDIFIFVKFFLDALFILRFEMPFSFFLRSFQKVLFLIEATKSLTNNQDNH